MHYFITNLQKFSEDTKAVEKLKKYLQDIEGVFPTIEDVYGQAWDGGQINIELDGSPGGSTYRYRSNTHVVKMGIYNRSIQNKKFPENLWGCLLHETLHAFMNPIIKNKVANKDFNGGYRKEPFIRSFLAMVYLRLCEKKVISQQLNKGFSDKLEEEMENDGGKSLFKDYVSMFSTNTNNFSKFISYLKSSDTAFTDRSNFSQDLDKAKKFLMQ